VVNRLINYKLLLNGKTQLSTSDIESHSIGISLYDEVAETSPVELAIAA